MTSTAMPATCAAISCVVHPSQALTAAGAVWSIAVRNASASRLRSTTAPSPRSVPDPAPLPMLKATCFDHDRIILSTGDAGFDSRLSVRPADRPCHMRNPHGTRTNRGLDALHAEELDRSRKGIVYRDGRVPMTAPGATAAGAARLRR